MDSAAAAKELELIAHCARRLRSTLAARGQDDILTAAEFIIQTATALRESLHAPPQATTTAPLLLGEMVRRLEELEYTVNHQLDVRIGAETMHEAIRRIAKG